MIDEKEKIMENYLTQTVALIKVAILKESLQTTKHIINQILTAFLKNDKTEHKKLYLNIKTHIDNIKNNDTKNKNTAISKIDKYFNKNMNKIIKELCNNKN